MSFLIITIIWRRVQYFIFSVWYTWTKAGMGQIISKYLCGIQGHQFKKWGVCWWIWTISQKGIYSQVIQFTDIIEFYCHYFDFKQDCLRSPWFWPLLKYSYLYLWSPIWDFFNLQITFFRKSVFFWANIPDKVHEVWGHITNKMRRFGNRGLAQLGEVRTFTFLKECLDLSYCTFLGSLWIFVEGNSRVGEKMCSKTQYP